MIREISKKEFEEKFPEISTYGINWTQVFLENGVILLDSEWNGEEYIVRGLDGSEKVYTPVYSEVDEDEFEIVGYEEIG